MAKKTKHGESERIKEYGYGDCYLYKIRCLCGEECGGWTPLEAEKSFKEHLKVSP